MDLNMRDIDTVAGAYPGDISVFEVEGGRLKPLYFSEGIPALSGMTADEYRAIIALDASEIVAETDRERVARTLGEALAAGTDADLSYRILHTSHGVTWVHAKSRFIGQMNGNPIILCAFLDTAAETNLHEELLDRISEAVHVCDVSTLEVLYLNKSAIDIFGTDEAPYGRTCYEYLHSRTTPCPWCGLGEGRISEAHIEEMYDADLNRYFGYNRQRVSWHGRDAYAVFVTDITARKAEEARYRKTVNDLLSANPQALCAFELNLTQNICDEGRSTSNYVQSTLASDTADGVFANLAKLIVDDSDLDKCRKMFDRQGLMDAFSQGRDHLSIEYRRLSDRHRVIWARTYLSMVLNPTTNDIEAVIYSEDIDGQKRREMANRIVTENGYDYIALIDIHNSTVSFQEMGAQVPERYIGIYSGKVDLGDYDSAITFSIDSWVHPEDVEMFRQASAIEHIVSMLDAQGSYEYVMRCVREGSIRRKRLQYAYLDDLHQTIVLWQTDITEAVQKEREDAERLEVALTAAKQASNAKSVFLSRMSHEIRTPMNAIIGMDTLAIQAVGDDERVTDCLAKIGISSRYLLSLINDILDMSRIESGKMLLANESFLLRDLVTGVNDMIYSQAKAKGLDYECTVGADAVEAFIGDAMKLQQVLVNLLGNAVKFTEAGKVTLSVQQIARKNDQARLRFVVNDTGKGVGEEDQRRIFEPFEQVDSSTTTVFGGTGLGLAITKSLVELMGGTLRLRSIEGVGSEFTVEVPLAIDESIVGAPKPAYNFEKMHTLVVDDDIITCEQAEQILKDIGMIGEWVTSGADAVQKVRDITEKKSRYDFILIDWKMPDMDGIETTSRIRRIVGPDVTIIIISAYDWQSIEMEAKAAGANLLISKPLFKSTLISAFQKAQNHIEESAPAPIDFDFSGKRVLVAEDNAINAEIAKDLLESKGFTVEVAEDGLRAMEMFTQSAVGYYDAILMDVRMPQMDGLQATSNIRRWSKEDAATIPIIAMTANAFDEDVEKSRAAGMNAHLAKPIEPELMFRTLHRILDEGDE